MGMCGFPNVFFGKTIGHHSVSVKLWSAVYHEQPARVGLRSQVFVQPFEL